MEHTVSAYSEGYDAYCEGIDRDQNPGVDGSREWREWFEGWDTAENQRK